MSAACVIQIFLTHETICKPVFRIKGPVLQSSVSVSTALLLHIQPLQIADHHIFSSVVDCMCACESRIKDSTHFT